MTSEKYMTFRIAGSWYGVDFIRVRNVIESERLRGPVPDRTNLCGVVDVEGISVPVLDMGRLLGNIPTEHHSGKIIFLATGAKGSVGFLVDQIEGSICLMPGAAAGGHDAGRLNPHGPVIGSARTTDKTYLLLDIVKLISCSGLDQDRDSACLSGAILNTRTKK